MDIIALRHQNDELRKQVITNLKRCGRSEVFADYVEEQMKILAQIEQLDYELIQLEDDFLKEYADPQDPES